ncbi:MAG: tetratricopeptide (TPR) repeat protein [Bacteroidia bacterium]|jgi:tetratricopeptide (TPR) repeat protein
MVGSRERASRSQQWREMMHTQGGIRTMASARKLSVFTVLLRLLFLFHVMLFASKSAWAQEPRLPALTPLAVADTQSVRTQQALEKAAASGDYTLALKPAQELARHLSADRQWAPVALTNLALVQLHVGDRDSAMTNLQMAVAQLKQGGNFRDPRLTSPLYALGISYYQIEQYPLAIEYIEQANFIVRTDRGLESLEQTAYDEQLLESLLKTGRLDGATDRLESSLNIHRQALKGGPELEQALASAARWYRRLDAPYQESLLHEERLDIMVAEHGDEHPDLVPIYYDLAGSYSRRMRRDLDKLRDIKAAERNVSYSFVRTDQVRRAIRNDFGESPDNRSLLDSEWKAVRALKIALRIQEEQSPSDKAAIGESYTRLGDHYQLLGDSRKARRYYQRAYALLQEAGAEQRLADTFGRPVPLYRKPMKLPPTSDPELLRAYRGEVELVMDVNSRGQPRNVEFLEARPEQAEELKVKAIRNSKDTIFRPKFSDKGTEKTEQVKFIYRFQPSPEAP